MPPEFKDTKIYSLDLGAVLAGARYRGDFEGRIKAVVGALQKIPGAILFIDEIHTIVGAGSTSGGSMDASNLLKPILAAVSYTHLDVYKRQAGIRCCWCCRPIMC